MKNLFSNCLHKNLNKKSGVYCIYCKNHTYIGSSKNLYYRLKRHVSDLNRSKHANKFLQNIYNKYGKELIHFKIIKYCDEKVLIKQELHYIKTLKPDINIDLNPVKRTFKKDSLLKISNSLKERYKNGLKNPFSKIVHRYTPNGDYIDSFESCAKASKILELPSKKISKAASGKGQSCGNYLWSYEKVEVLYRNIKQAKRVISKNRNNVIIDSWLSIKELSISLGISQSATSIRIKNGRYYNDLKYEFYQVPG